MTKLEQAARQALEALEKAERQLGYNNIVPHSCYKDAITALREALAEQAEQEPVAWLYRGEVHAFDPSGWAKGEVTPLYATPVQQVNLTDDEIHKAVLVAVNSNELNAMGIARAVIAAYKEKNK